MATVAVQPTPKQIAWLARMKLPAPPTKRECQLLIDYVLRGENEDDPESVSTRVRRLDHLHRAEVMIRKPRSPHYNKVGRVILVRVRSRQERDKISSRSPAKPGALVLTVQIDGKIKVQCARSNLKILTGGKQRKLFE